MIGAPTPSYVGSHVTGFSNMVKAMADMAEPTGKKNGKVNIIPGWVEPCDMEEIKRLAAMVGVDITLFPDTSGVLNGPLTGEYSMFPKGGTTVAELKGSRRRHRHPGAGRMVFGRCRPTARHQVQGALPGPRHALRSEGHRPLHRRPADRGRHLGARRRYPSSAASWST